MKYLAAIVAGLHPIIWARGWELYERFVARRTKAGGSASTAPGSLSARDRETMEHLATWRMR